MRAIVYRGMARETEVHCDVTILDCGAGTTSCVECGGTGWWDFAEPEIVGEPCVECKGTGRVFVGV